MSKRGYQYDYSRDNEAMHSADGRHRKAATMLAVLRESLGDRLTQAQVLNLGCSTGFIDEFLAPHVRSMNGVDIDQVAVDVATTRCVNKNIAFEVGDAMQLRFADASFDVVICSQVYEHVPDPVRMMSEIRRVLRTGGFCYFAATNRWAMMERHYHLPFLSWLPIPVANQYVRLVGKGQAYYERHLGRRALLALVADFRVEDYTGKILAQPDRYAAAYMIRGGIRKSLANAVFKYFRGLVPGYIWLLWK